MGHATGVPSRWGRALARLASAGVRDVSPSCGHIDRDSEVPHLAGIGGRGRPEGRVVALSLVQNVVLHELRRARGPPPLLRRATTDCRSMDAHVCARAHACRAHAQVHGHVGTSVCERHVYMSTVRDVARRQTDPQRLCRRGRCVNCQQGREGHMRAACTTTSEEALVSPRAPCVHRRLWGGASF